VLRTLLACQVRTSLLCSAAAWGGDREVLSAFLRFSLGACELERELRFLGPGDKKCLLFQEAITGKIAAYDELLVRTVLINLGEREQMVAPWSTLLVTSSACTLFV
jgi:hypothetical protein